MRRRAVGLAIERLQLLDSRSRQRVRDIARFDAEIEARQPFGIIFRSRQCPDDVEQLFFGQADQRAAQKRAEGQGVAPVGEHARKRDEILNLLSAKQAFASLGGNRNAMPLEGLFIAPKIASGGGEQRDVAGPADAACARAAVEDHFAANQAGAHLGDHLCFAVALLFRRSLAVFIGYGHVEGRDAQRLATMGVEWIKRREPGLAITRQQGLEAFVHIGQDWRAGAEIGRNRQDTVRILHYEGVARSDIGADVRAAEAINSLFGIANQKQRPRTDGEGGPVRCCALGGGLPAQAPEDLGL